MVKTTKCRECSKYRKYYGVEYCKGTSTKSIYTALEGMDYNKVCNNFELLQRDLASEYENQLCEANLSKPTIRIYTNAFNQFRKWFVEEFKEDISKDDQDLVIGRLDDFLNTLSVSKSTKKSYVAAINKWFE